MNELQLKPGLLSGRISAPASKSDGQRALLCAALADGTSHITGLGVSNDERAMLEIARMLGRTITIENNRTTVSGELSIDRELTLHAGESGLTSRLVTGVAGAFDQWITVSGEGSLLKRPMEFWQHTLPQFHVEVQTVNGFLPLKIRGPYRRFDGEADGSQSSQYISGLFIGLAFAGKGFHIRVKNLVSSAYLHMTLRTLKRFGIDISADGDWYKLTAGSRFRADNYTVEADWSSASFWLIAAALGNPLIISGLDRNSLQADVAVLNALGLAGCHILQEDGAIRVTVDSLTAFSFDATNCPDLFPVLAVLATQCEGTTVLRGVHRLKHKESDRATAIRRELGKMGAHIDISGDDMRISGPVKLHGATLDSHHDHRMAMSLAIAATIADSSSFLTGADSVSKSYPAFWEDFQQLSASS